MELAVRSTNAWEREPPVVATFGEAMVRLSTPARERIATAPALALHVAGAEVNVAVDLALLGVPAAWIGTLPRGPLGRRAAAELRATGVMLDHVAWADGGRMGLFFVEQGAGARPTAVHYDRAGSAFATGARWPAGAIALADGQLHEVAALPTAVIDRLGIGDAFAAGLLSGLVDELAPSAALARGAALAALKATIAGDHAFVSREELDAAVARLLASASGPLRPGRASEVAPSAAGPGQAGLGSEVAR